MHRRFRIFLFLCCAFLTTGAFAQTARFTPAEIAGTYSISSEFFSHNIILRPDGTFAASAMSDSCEVNPKNPNDCLNYPQDSGTFSVSGSIVRFRVLNYRRWASPNQSIIPPSRYFEKIVLKWSERFYLLDKTELKNFANAVNLRTEPRKDTGIGFANYFFLRREGVETPVVGLPDLPGGWNDLLLKAPVRATVLSIKSADGKRFAVIDKGRDDGLKIGMQMVTWFFPSGSEIVAVTKKTATVRMKSRSAEGQEFLEPGDVISTRFEPFWFMKLKPRAKR
ncbi:MAG: hypothetical protein JSS81_17460 [Acidobacteria bacterium]|nr:hypothetical protein [Acidobacteriota bacterium]